MPDKHPASKVPDESLPEWGRKLLWLDDPQQVSRLVKGLAILCVALFVLDFVIHRHAYFSFEKWYGFYAFAGFVAFALIVLAAKQLRRLILRSEDYYAPQAVDAEDYPEQGLQPLQHGQAPPDAGTGVAENEGSHP